MYELIAELRSAQRCLHFSRERILKRDEDLKMLQFVMCKCSLNDAVSKLTTSLVKFEALHNKSSHVSHRLTGHVQFASGSHQARLPVEPMR